MRRPRILDLYCGQGTASLGYYLAGFDVIGVDPQPDPRYPFSVITREPFAAVSDNRLLAEFDAVHLGITASGLLSHLDMPWISETRVTLGATQLCGRQLGLSGNHRWYRTSFPVSSTCRCPAGWPAGGIAPEYTRWLGEQLLSYLESHTFSRDAERSRIGELAAR